MQKVPSDFKPDDRIYQLSSENGIPVEFVNNQINQFVFYWQEKQIRRKSWQLTFWNWVKIGWDMKKKRDAKQIRTSPSSNKDWEWKKPEKASKETAKEALRQLGLRKYR